MSDSGVPQKKGRRIGGVPHYVPYLLVTALIASLSWGFIRATGTSRTLLGVFLLVCLLGFPLGISRNRKQLQYGLVAPATFVLVFVSLLPVCFVVVLSLTGARISVFQGQIPWVGLENYKRILFEDLQSRAALTRTLLFVLYSVTGQTVMGLILALLLNRKIPGGGLLTTMLLIPVMSPPIIVGLLWRNFLAWDGGLFNNILGSIGFGPIPFLTNRVPRVLSWLGPNITRAFQLNYGFLSAVCMAIWQWTPFMGLILLAGLRAIPIELYEAADVDGASKYQSFRYITLPQLKPILMVALTLRSLDAFKVFEPVWALFGNSPLYRTLAVDIFTRAIEQHQFGLASAQAVMLLLISLTVTMLVLYIDRRERN